MIAQHAGDFGHVATRVQQSLSTTTSSLGAWGTLWLFGRAYSLGGGVLGFDKGEAITLPSVHDASLWDKFDEASTALFAATQTGEPAPRYRTV